MTESFHTVKSRATILGVEQEKILGWIHSGELLAIKEFNDANAHRKIERHEFLTQKRLLKNAYWIKQMFFAHMLDSASRTTRREGAPVVLTNPYFKK